MRDQPPSSSCSADYADELAVEREQLRACQSELVALRDRSGRELAELRAALQHERERSHLLGVELAACSERADRLAVDATGDLGQSLRANREAHDMLSDAQVRHRGARQRD